MCNVLQAVVWIVWRAGAISLRSYRVVQERLLGAFIGLIVYMTECQSFTEVVFSGPARKFLETGASKRAIFLSNHTSFADWAALFMVAYRKQVHGVCKVHDPMSDARPS